MLSIGKVLAHSQQLLGSEMSKDYFDKCCANLKYTIKRSNLISQFVLFIIVFNFFSEDFLRLKLFDVEFNISIIKVLTPAVLSYFIFEWLMLAKRRRDLIYTMQQLTYSLYNIYPNDSERLFPNFHPSTLNIMPFSLMSEILSIDTDRKKFKSCLKRFTIYCMPIILTVIIVCSIAQLLKVYNFQWKFVWPKNIQCFIETFSIYASIGISFLFIIWTIFYYLTEFENKKLLLNAAKDAKEQCTTQNIVRRP